MPHYVPWALASRWLEELEESMRRPADGLVTVVSLKGRLMFACSRLLVPTYD